MNTKHIVALLFLTLTWDFVLAQEKEADAGFGKTINVSVGLGYYRYVGYPVQTIHADYELQIDKNLTAAPFVTIYSYNSSYVWGDLNTSYRKYDYSETAIPIGIKVSYYLDDLVNAASQWDFYFSGSLGYVFRKTIWETAYDGKKEINPGMGPLYLDVHTGAEFHVTKPLGLTLDVSLTMATLGIAVHLP